MIVAFKTLPSQPNAPLVAGEGPGVCGRRGRRTTLQITGEGWRGTGRALLTPTCLPYEPRCLRAPILTCKNPEKPSSLCAPGIRTLPLCVRTCVLAVFLRCFLPGRGSHVSFCCRFHALSSKKCCCLLQLPAAHASRTTQNHAKITPINRAKQKQPFRASLGKV